MDILAHGLWAAGGAKAVNKAKKEKRISPPWAAFWGVFPDLFAFLFPFAFVILAMLSGDISFSEFNGPRSENEIISNAFKLSPYLYQFSHSIVIFSAAFLAVWVFKKKIPFAMFGWLLHILIDIPTHSIDFYATPFLWPVSEYRFPHGSSWANPIFMIINYALLAGLYIYFFLNRKKSV